MIPLYLLTVLLCLIVVIYLGTHIYIDERCLGSFEDLSIVGSFIAVLPIVNLIATTIAVFAFRNAIRRDVVKLRGDDKVTRWIIQHFIR